MAFVLVGRDAGVGRDLDAPVRERLQRRRVVGRRALLPPNQPLNIEQAPSEPDSAADRRARAAAPRRRSRCATS